MNLYSGIIQFCIWTSAAMALAFAALVVRRWLTERRAPIYKARQTAITRDYLQRVSGQEQTGQKDRWSIEERLEAVGHLLLLLRGGDRDRLIQLAEIDNLLKTALRQSGAWRAARRIDAIRTLQQFGGEAAIARLRAILGTDRHRVVRLNAAFALASFGRLPPPRETIGLIGMAGRAHTRLDVAVLRAMAPKYAVHLQRMLEDVMSHEWRAAIIDGLGWSDDHSVVPTLKRACAFDHVEIRCAALRSLARLGSHAAADCILQALGDASPVVRIQAINSCVSLQLREAVPTLERLITDPELWVRIRAEEALAKFEFDESSANAVA